MPKNERHKMKLLYLAEWLRRETDEEHGLTAAELLRRLESKGIHAERKSIYDDIRILTEYGMDIVNGRGPQGGYRLLHREFELPELKLLVDAVQSSKFLSERKSRALIRKLESLTSRWEAQRLQRQVYTVGRTKSKNENIYYSIDTIHTAISSDKQIAFRYFEWTMEKSARYRRGGAVYERSPYALVWDDENYYLVAYDHTASPPAIRHYRVDRMENLRILDVPRAGGEVFEGMDLAQYAQHTFGMFGGEAQEIELRFAARLAGVVLDRFGKETIFLPGGDGTFRVYVHAVVSPQFMGWLAGFGPEAKLMGPPKVREEYVTFCRAMLAQYDEPDAAGAPDAPDAPAGALTENTPEQTQEDAPGKILNEYPNEM
ncbi:MAG: WYL domain-containing protein [Subdoligranulum sp.]|nr:WYL domain-containing protein [Subdoligranulum sp.]